MKKKRKNEESMEGSENGSPSDMALELSLRKNLFKLLPCLASGICIFAVLYSASYVALFWLTPYEVVDMRSELTADYGAWDFLPSNRLILPSSKKSDRTEGYPRRLSSVDQPGQHQPVQP